ncbi:MAG: Anti-sigma regulatory factor [Candidatus Alkanophagales archaeon MCA70_species_2]|nr:Anti-sigma regulatory factor [Candidatus Alkanophaga liquidiphilum]
MTCVIATTGAGRSDLKFKPKRGTMLELRFAAASRPKKGETVNGDAFFLREFDENALVVVADGLGHGEAASVAAQKVLEFAERNFRLGIELEMFVRGCHGSLMGTRGAVVGAALVNKEKERLSYVGVGNITALIKTKSGTSHLTSLGGIIGYNLRKLRRFEYSFRSGSVLVMCTDGISRFAPSEYDFTSLESTAKRILEEHGKDDDDATVVVVEAI